MWLLDTTTLILRFFADPEGVYYAILSHTWGNEEITFQDMNASAGPDKTKKGWRKIAETCRLARHQHQLEYAWVDTCCIDKSSSAELSEAINSMFDWYKSSAVCFVFLEDVTFPHPHGGASAPWRSNPELQGLLRQARWFSRGWTLQELVASRHVVFYDAMGTELGTKGDLAVELVQITNIDLAVLRNVDKLHMVPVARKMSWAAFRHTTRVEDMAYCLLGMFDVHMPLLYGEGTRAFLRLQEEIARSGSDWSLLAWSSHPTFGTFARSQICGIFAPSPAEFWNGHSIRLPGWALEQNFELTLADRGFLRINRNTYTYDDDRARLVLDCLIPDNEMPSGTSWLEVDLRKVGSFYARTGLGPFALAKTIKRRREEPGDSWLQEPVSVATAIPAALVEAYRIRPQPSHLLYTQSFWRHVGATQGIESSSDPLTNPLPLSPSAVVQLAVPKGKNYKFHAVRKFPTDSATNLDNAFFEVNEGVFSTKGIRGSRHHHLFEFNSVPVALVWCQELTMTENRSSPPWAILLCPDTCVVGTGGWRVLHPHVFRRLSSGQGGMSEEERSKVLHDYVFQWYSDDTGGYRTEDIPTVLRLQGFDELTGSPVLHEIQVHAALGLSNRLESEMNGSNSLVSLVLSYRQLPVDSKA